MAKRTVEQQIADLEARKLRDELRVTARGKLDELKTVMGKRQWGAARVTHAQLGELLQAVEAAAAACDGDDDAPGAGDIADLFPNATAPVQS